MAREQTKEPPSSRRRELAAILALSAVTVVTFGNTLFNGFVWDDRHLIIEDDRLVTPANLPHIFTSDFFSLEEYDAKYGYYRPLTTLSFMIDRLVWGLSPSGFHLTNLLLHVACVLLVFAVARRLFGKRSPAPFVSALLFAVHPIHTESVAWISGRTDLLATAFCLSVLYLRRPEGARSRRAARIVAGVALAACAQLSKETALILPLLVYLQDRAHGESRRRAVSLMLPYAAVSAATLGLRFALRLPTNPLTPHPPPAHLATAAKTFWRYVGELLSPMPLTAYIQNPWIDRFGLAMVAALVSVLPVIAAYLVIRNRRRQRFLFLAFTASLIPLANLVPITAPLEMGFPMAERFLYLPSVFFCMGLGGLAAHLSRARYRTAVICGIAAVATAFGGVCVFRNADWRTSRTLFEATHARAGDSHYVKGMLAMTLAEAGELEAAEKLYRSALSVYRRQTGTDHPQFAIGLALVFLKKNKPEAALSLVAPLEAIDFPLDQLGCIVGEAHRQMGALEDAEAAFLRCLGGRPDSLSARLGLAAIARQRKAPERALRFYAAILEANGELPDVIASMGDIHRETGNLEAAMKAYRRAIELRPELDAAHVAAGSILAKQGDLEAAEARFRKALELNPRQNEARVSLAILEARQGRTREAEDRMKRVLRQDPENRAALFNLGVRYLRQGRIPLGKTVLERLRNIAPEDERTAALLERISRGGGLP